MDELANALQDIPLAALIPMVAALVVGLLLWAAGRRLLRTGFAALGLLVGFGFGWLLGESINIGVPSWSIGVIVGVVLAVAAVVLYRAAIAATMAGILAVASPLAVVALYEWQGRQVFVERPTEEAFEQESAFEPDELTEWLNGQRDEIVREQMGEFIPDEIAQQLKRARSFGERLLEGFREAWASTDESVRPGLIGAAISGAVLGLIVGGLLSGFSAAVITAFGGSLLWMGSMRVLLERVGWGDLDFLPATGRGWLIVWLVAACVGLAIQWTLGWRRADKG